MNLKWDQRFLDQAAFTASWSRDPSTKVGAVIVDDQKRIVAQGFNGFARGVQDLPSRYNDRETKYKFVVHAELNAILNAGRNVEGCTIYTTLPPCHDCAKAIIQAGIKRVVSVRSDVSRWQDSFNVANQMFQEAGVEIILATSTGCYVEEIPL